MDRRVVPYEGKEPYIFLSYCHKDAPAVYPLMEQMSRDGFRIWYDDGNRAGEDWWDNLAEHLDRSHVCLAMISPNSAASHNCKREVSFTLELDKTLMAVILEDFVMPKGMRFQLSNVHYLKRSSFSSDMDLLWKLCETDAMKACRDVDGIRRQQEEEERRRRAEEEARRKAEEEVRRRAEEEARRRAEEEARRKAEEEARHRAEEEARRRAEEEARRKAEEEARRKAEEEARHRAEEEARRRAEEEARHRAEEEARRRAEEEARRRAEEEARRKAEEEARRRKAEAKRPAVLIRLNNMASWFLTDEQTRIGRLGGARDVVLHDNFSVSRHHADIIRSEGKFFLKDNGSLNGTFVNHERLESGGRVKLESPALFRLYDENLILLFGSDAREEWLRESIGVLYNAKNQEFRLLDDGPTPQNPMLLGRNHVWAGGTLDDPKISRNHAQIYRLGSKLFLADVGSRNGTFLNEERLAVHESRALNNGDRIRLGGTVLQVGIIAGKEQQE